ncbi:E3 ubiquitin-protein ligase TRIM31-like [Ochotona curzoniae]|uniref:E3 ubiquitin-protein ligase TRIM31-like n=1 Tax=Ochotona curzoniae TaxID=130825 RepID=UPI001B34A2ED|nr:E3 ubiquitin-protein ligase TRIM31-like [Ochotona curzoniae]
MASQQFSTDLQKELICPICLDILQDPVIIKCGHNFCHDCITQCKEVSEDLIQCPLCKSFMRKDTFISNWQLGNLVERIRATDLSEMQQEEEQLRCPKHGEKLHYFCEEDGELLCMMCHDSMDHKLHKTSLVEEADPHYQEQIQLHVEILRQKAQGEEKINNFMAQVEFEKQKIHTEFKHLQQILEENKNFFLSNIKQLAQKGTKECERYNAAIQAQLSLLKDSVKVMQQMPPRELLQKQLDKAKSSHDSIIKNLRNLEAPVTFDTASAHPSLKFSQDLKTVRVDMIPRKHSEDTVEPQRFYPSCCLLGSPGFSTGRHTWEVERRGPGGGACILGVAWEQAPRQGSLTLEPASGFWVLKITSFFECQALTGSNTWEELPVCPRRVRVCVDLEEKEVTFYDAATNDCIYKFNASFPGKIFPFFRLLFSGTQLTLNP